jgi:uncharacterized phage protein (TIGR02216 family)
MAFALGRLRWTPDAFWRATPRELAAAARAARPQTPEPAARADLERLMRAYPDGA